MHGGHVLGGKVRNSLAKLENVGNSFLPAVQAAATMAGYPELGVFKLLNAELIT